MIARLARLLWRTQLGTDGRCGNEVYKLPVIESLGVVTACVNGDAAVLNPGVRGSGSRPNGGKYLGSPDI